jgi:alkaline phosphatase D
MVRLARFIPLLLLLAGCRTVAPDRQGAFDVIAFGSCAQQDKPQPIWDAIIAQNPDVFLFIGDNIYADTEDMAVMRAKYAEQDSQPGYQRLREHVPILATWDDHDYGKNDAGVEYPKKDSAQLAFLDFFRVPSSAAPRHRGGVYDAHVFGPEGRRVQIILLDTRYFRSPLARWPEGERPTRGPYKPHLDPYATVLGRDQWIWLEEQLRTPAEVRVIVSSIQAIPDKHGFETWANFPHERDRLFRLIRDTGAGGAVIVSGDRHVAEISRLPGADPNGAGYPLYDITSSSLNKPSRNVQPDPNPYRTSATQYGPANFGVIDIDWERPDPLLRLQIRGEDGQIAFQEEIRLSELQQ